MGVFTYLDLIKGIENDDTIKLIGRIDLSLLKTRTGYSLNYSLPLIERIILEIYKLVPESDVEQYQQGTMRTPKSIIDCNNSILPSNTINIIEDIYGDDGIRNKLFHVENSNLKIPIKIFDKIDFLIMQLLSILTKKIKENKCFEIRDIKYL